MLIVALVKRSTLCLRVCRWRCYYVLASDETNSCRRRRMPLARVRNTDVENEALMAAVPGGLCGRLALWAVLIAEAVWLVHVISRGEQHVRKCQGFLVCGGGKGGCSLAHSVGLGEVLRWAGPGRRRTNAGCRFTSLMTASEMAPTPQDRILQMS